MSATQRQSNRTRGQDICFYQQPSYSSPTIITTSMMRTMNGYHEFPPFDKLKKVLYNCPQAALLYIKLNTLNENRKRLSIKKKEVKQKLLLSQTLLRNHLFAISRLDLLTFEETPDYFLVDFVSDV